jgi:hypothetical protein
MFARRAACTTQVFGHKTEGWGSFVCAGLVRDLTFEVCLQVEVKERRWQTVKCHPVTYRDVEFGEVSADISCKVSSWYRTTAWLGVGKERGIRKVSSRVECEENLAEEGIGLL